MKSFTSGFESIFGVSAEEIELGVAEDQVEVLPLEKDKPDTQPQRRRRYSRRVKKVSSGDARSNAKNFTSDLESLFRDALTDSFEEPILKEALSDPAPQAQPSPRKDHKSAPRQTQRKRRISTPGGSGLDLLIRQTTDETILEYESTTKKVTFVFDKEKLKKLKRIAKERNLFLKDIIGEVVTKFIREYEDSNSKMPPSEN